MVKGSAEVIDTYGDVSGIKINTHCMFVEPVEKLAVLEEWEDRLEKLKVAFVLASFEVRNTRKEVRKVYSLFIDSKESSDLFE